jgi:hypothetical protein
MNDSPSVRLAAKHHRHPQVKSRFFRPARDAESNLLGLDEVSEVCPDRASNFLSIARTI